MSPVDIWVNRQRRRLEWGRLLGPLADWLAVGSCLWGLAILLSKLFWTAFWPEVSWAGCFLIVLPPSCWWVFRKQAFTHAQAALVLDRRLGAGGLLMSVWEVGADESWNFRLPETSLLWSDGLVRVRPARFVRILGLPLLFLSACYVIPAREVQSSPREILQRETRELESLIEQMESEELVQSVDARAMVDQIRNLRQQSADGPLTHDQWEVLDTIRERLDLRAAEALFQNQQGLKALTELTGLADGELENLSPERLAEMRSAAELALREVLRDPAMISDLPQDFREIVEGLIVDGEFRLPADLSGQLSLLQQLQSQLSFRSDELGDLRSLTSEFSSPFLFATPSISGPVEAAASFAVTYGKEVESQAEKFRDLVLPRGSEPGQPGIDRPDLSSRRPDVDFSAPVSQRNAVRKQISTTGRESRGRQLRPRHQQIIRNYFGTIDEIQNDPETEER